MAIQPNLGDAANAVSPRPLPRSFVSGKPGFLQRPGAQTFLRALTMIAALCSFAIIFIMLAFLFIYAWPAITFW